MTKSDIVNEVAKATGIEKIAVANVVDATLEAIKNSVSKGKGGEVYLRGFGTFGYKHRAKKAARNITKGTTVTIPEHDVPSFKPSKAFTIK
ncbi:MAG: integration host factor subunit beta [Bacteroidales bacterium]|nr:integration host factor subunit beta [Bacteroidales bacterium]